VIGNHGAPGELARYLPLLDRGLDQMGRHPNETRGYRSQASRALVSAGWQFVERGAQIPSQPRTAGESALFLTALAKRTDFRPDGWRNIAESLFAIAEPPLTASLFPTGFTFKRKGAGDWPN